MARASTLALLLALPLTAGCFVFDRAMVGVDRVGPERVDRELNANALTGPLPSASTLEVLHSLGLSKLFERAPDEALEELHRATAAEPERRCLHALAELSYLRGKQLLSRDHFLAAAVYAYLYLLGEPELPPPSPYDRRFRWACDFYNRGLRAALLAPDGRTLAMDAERRTLPIGSIEIAVDRAQFPVDDPRLEFLPADDYSVWGLSVRVRDSGLGAPLIARLRGVDVSDAEAAGVRHGPGTAFLRIEGGIADVERGVHAVLELHSAFEPLEIEVGDHVVPLESDLSAALAFALDDSNLWKFSSRGFFRGDEASRETKLSLGRPYQPGLVPVVFVHGTASSPANWAEMFNMLQADPAIRERTQFWFFQYPSGNPIPFSAAQLRTALTDLVAELDPAGEDAALRKMVIVGHSQGGLLTKLMAVDGDMSWWDDITGRPIAEFGLRADQEELIRSVLDFDPLPFVTRVVYISTPHRGSFLAARPFARWLAKTIALPRELVGFGESMLRNQKKLPSGFEPRVPTSLDNMHPKNPFLLRLARAPLAPGVAANSIIAIGDADPAHPEGADDGVVEYASAHVDGVESEFLVPVAHSCQTDPRAIRELRRILLAHLATP